MARAAVRPKAVTRRAASVVGRPPKPGFLEMVDPTLVDAPPSGGRWGHEIKWDGYRAQAHLKDGRVQIFTRQGHDWTKQFWPVAVALTELKATDAILDGEMVAIGASGVSDFHELRRQLGQTHPKLVYQAFDLLWLDGEDLRPLPLLERKQRLARLLSGSGRCWRSSTSSRPRAARC
jgi:bifunctional non-homologous end joining protein LigD